MSLTDELERLARLHAEGRLSDSEYATAKGRLLATPASAPADGLGRQLNGFRRAREDRWLGGVCGGLALSTGVAAWVWRLAFLMLFLCAGSGVVLYLLAWLLVPLAEPQVPPAARVAH